MNSIAILLACAFVLGVVVIILAAIKDMFWLGLIGIAISGSASILAEWLIHRRTA